MAYSKYGKIEASDLGSTLLGAATSTSSSNINSVWSTGNGKGGYGQTALASVASNGTLLASQWASLINTVSAVASHQGTAITAITAPTTGSPVLHYSSLPTNITNVYNGRNNAAAQGSTSVTNTVNSSTWFNAITFTQTVTFASGDAARYFFNSGGQLKLTCSHANTTAGINLLFNQLCSNVGTVVQSAPSSGAVTISGVSYNGVTKIGGGGNAPTVSTNSGYYAMTVSNATIFTQTASTGPSGYLSTFIRAIAKSNGTQGSNGDTGSIITIYTIWDEVPDGLVVGTGSTTTVTAQAPETTNLANTWGTITIAGSVSGS
jgi:hypothetical protein